MSACPTCPTCGDFAPWVVSESEVRESDPKGAWPGQNEFERITGGGEVRRCVNGHNIPARKVVWK